MNETAEEIKGVTSDKGNVTEIPLMWTIYGNRPVASCNLDAIWTEDVGHIYVNREFKDKVSGEIVRTDVDVYFKRGQAVAGHQAKMGG